jgi:hypothetical protein
MCNEKEVILARVDDLPSWVRHWSTSRALGGYFYPQNTVIKNENIFQAVLCIIHSNNFFLVGSSLLRSCPQADRAWNEWKLKVQD